MGKSCTNARNSKLARWLVMSLGSALLFNLITTGTSWSEIFHLKNGSKVTVKKEIWICDEARGGGARNFDCQIEYETSQGTFRLPYGPNNGLLNRYVPCASVDGCRTTESVFGAEIFKEVAVIPELSSEGIKTNLSKFHYAVTEDDIDDVIGTENDCFAVGFRHQVDSSMVQGSSQELVSYQICVDYSGDCTGTIKSHEKKICTIKNYIFRGSVENPINE